MRIARHLAAEPLLAALAQWEAVMAASHDLLAQRFNIHHATLQPEPVARTVLERPRHTTKPAAHP